MDSPDHYKDTSKILVGTSKAINAEARINAQETNNSVQPEDSPEIKQSKFITLRAKLKTLSFNISSIQEKIADSSGWFSFFGNDKEDLIASLEATKNKLLEERQKINEKANAVSDAMSHEEKERAKSFEEAGVDPEFESDIFKPYNLIRKTHVEFAFSKQISAALKSLPENIEEGITHNIELIK